MYKNEGECLEKFPAKVHKTNLSWTTIAFLLVRGDAVARVDGSVVVAGPEIRGGARDAVIASVAVGDGVSTAILAVRRNAPVGSSLRCGMVMMALEDPISVHQYPKSKLMLLIILLSTFRYKVSKFSNLDITKKGKMSNQKH